MAVTVEVSLRFTVVHNKSTNDLVLLQKFQVKQKRRNVHGNSEEAAYYKVDLKLQPGPDIRRSDLLEHLGSFVSLTITL